MLQTISPPAPLADSLIEQWALDPSITFINHGCFGARPRSVIKAQTARRDQYEARPIEWLDRRRVSMIVEARAALGQFVGAHPDNIGFTTNATSAINAVLRSLRFEPGDELLTTNHVYNAVRQTMRYVADRHGATYIEADVPLPLSSADDIIEAIEAGLSERTRLVLIDHITSPTAIIFPVRRIIELCDERGIDVLVDGAHAPGMLPLSSHGIDELGAAYYAGNLHKWVSAPSGAGFIWARPDRQKGIHPPTISHFLDQGLAAEFQWQGTRDITPWLCVQEALAYFETFGWDRVMRHNHQMAVWVQSMLCERFGVEPASPVDGSMIGSMATVPLPNQHRLRKDFVKPEQLQAALYDRHRIEAPIIDWRGRLWTRASCQIYNLPEHYERLAAAITELAIA
jgi:isopenicillin-N epimerase